MGRTYSRVNDKKHMKQSQDTRRREGSSGDGEKGCPEGGNSEIRRQQEEGNEGRREATATRTVGRTAKVFWGVNLTRPASNAV